jgi:alcohol dehydrogenase
VDALQRLGEFARELNARRAMVVSDRGVVQAGHTQRGLDALRKAGLQTDLFDQVHENPSTDDVAAGAAAARGFAPDLLVGLGGGSSMDCAKGVNFLYTNGGQMQDYWGVGKAQQPMLPMIAVPTTADGSRRHLPHFRRPDPCQDGLWDKSRVSRGHPRPATTLTQPQRVTALTGIDKWHMP